MIRIKKVDYVSDYKLALTFTDKKVKIVDLAKYKNKGKDTVFYPFKDIDFFKSVKVDNYTGTIVWPNGVDLCPDVLYEMGVEVKKESNLSQRRKAAAKESSAPATSKGRLAAKSST